MGRFVPIVRTFAPFLAGVAGMRYRRFFAFNVVGAIAWIASLVYAGYVFGNIPWVKDNLTFIVIGIVIVSLIPALVTYFKERAALTKRTRRAGALHPLREFRRKPDVGGGRERLQPLLGVIGHRKAVDERVQRLARHARLPAGERLELLVGAAPRHSGA